MSKELKIRTRYDIIRGWIYRILRWPYAMTALIGYVAVAFLVLGYMSQSPTYKSDMSLVMPGTGFSNNLNLADVGQATSQTLTPFSGGGFNPRVNYKEIIVGRGVVNDAAKRMGMTLEQFGKPQVLLTEQTSILTISVQGSSSLQAQQKASALHEAFQTELDRLRADESYRRDQSIRRVIGDYMSAMNDARQKVVNFQERSILVATVQLEQLTANYSQLQDKLLTAKVSRGRLNNYVNQLSADLGVSPALAGQAFALQSDAEFRGYLTELDASASLLSEYTSRWGSEHPKLKSVRQRYEQARLELVNRSRNLLGIQSGELLYSMNLQAIPNRAQLFSDLVSNYALLKGSESEIQNIERELEVMKDKLQIYSREAAELSRLELDFKLAEAVYTSAVARLDASKADIFASYPVVQVLTPPSIPWQPSNPRKSVAVAAGAGGCFLITLAILILWQRRFLITLLLKRS